MASSTGVTAPVAMIIQPLPPLRPAVGLFQARGGADGDENRAEPLAPLAGALKIRAGGLRKRLGFQVVERGAHDRPRRADLLRELAGKSTQVTRVFVEAGEQ